MTMIKLDKMKPATMLDKSNQLQLVDTKRNTQDCIKLRYLFVHARWLPDIDFLSDFNIKRTSLTS